MDHNLESKHKLTYAEHLNKELNNLKEKYNKMVIDHYDLDDLDDIMIFFHKRENKLNIKKKEINEELDELEFEIEQLEKRLFIAKEFNKDDIKELENELEQAELKQEYLEEKLDIIERHIEANKLAADAVNMELELNVKFGVQN